MINAEWVKRFKQSDVERQAVVWSQLSKTEKAQVKALKKKKKGSVK